MRVTPRSPEEIAAENEERASKTALWPKGIYDYEITSAEDAQSNASGADMIKLEVTVFYGENSRRIYDYLIDSMAEKLRSFCETNNLMKEYNGGTLLARHCEGLAGKCSIGNSRATKKYPEIKNEIKLYVSASPITDDDLPF